MKKKERRKDEKGGKRRKGEKGEGREEMREKRHDPQFAFLQARPLSFFNPQSFTLFGLVPIELVYSRMWVGLMLAGLRQNVLCFAVVAEALFRFPERRGVNRLERINTTGQTSFTPH